MIFQDTLLVTTRGRNSHDVTAQVGDVVKRSAITIGLCNIFVQHTSASVMLCENADPQVRGDLEAFMGRLVTDGDPLFRHVTEGPDDMPAHVRSVLTDSGITVPVRQGRCALGTWQGIYLWEHRTAPHRRSIVVTVYGERP